MIKAVGTLHGQPLLVVGLSRSNCEGLLAKGSIVLDTAELGLPQMTILVVAYETDDEIEAVLRASGVGRPS